jgi:hypothetical protein
MLFSVPPNFLKTMLPKFILPGSIITFEYHMSFSDIEKKVMSLSLDWLETATRKSFGNLLGSSPCSLPKNVRLNVARILLEKGVSYRKVARFMCLSLRDASHVAKTFATSHSKSCDEAHAVDVEVVKKAIELIRKREARNPNDLVIMLRIDLDTG